MWPLSSPFRFVFNIDDSRSNCAVYIVMLPFIMKETRAPVLLTRLARKLRAEKNDKRYRARVEDTRASLKRLIWVSCTRPIRE